MLFSPYNSVIFSLVTEAEKAGCMNDEPTPAVAIYEHVAIFFQGLGNEHSLIVSGTVESVEQALNDVRFGHGFVRLVTSQGQEVRVNPNAVRFIGAHS